MIITRLFGLILRVGILISSTIVAGIIGHYLDVMGKNDAKVGKRFIYAEVVAGISIVAAIVLMIPTTWALTVVPFDFIMFILWVRASRKFLGCAST